MNWQSADIPHIFISLYFFKSKNLFWVGNKLFVCLFTFACYRISSPWLKQYNEILFMNESYNERYLYDVYTSNNLTLKMSRKMLIALCKYIDMVYCTFLFDTRSPPPCFSFHSFFAIMRTVYYIVHCWTVS